MLYGLSLAAAEDMVRRAEEDGYLTTRRYKKKPVEVEAHRTFERVIIQTLEGQMIAEPGDWIVKGVKGEMYPVRNDIFRLTYEEVE